MICEPPTGAATKTPQTKMDFDTTRRSSQHSAAESLVAYVDDSDSIVHRTIRRYTQFMRQCYDGTVNKLYKRISVENSMYLYEERIDTFEASSFVHEIYPGARKHSSASERLRRRSQAYERMTQMNAFGGGEIAGTLEDVMAGVYTESSTDHAVNCAVQFGLERVLDSGIMETFESADEQHPFRYLGVKWIEVESILEGAEDVNTSVIDELYWIERTGIYTTKSGRKFGFQLVKTVDSDYASDDRLYRSIQRSVCYLYHQVDDDVVHVFVRGIIETPHLGSADVSRVVQQAATIMLAPTRARHCQRMRSIAGMIERSKTNRSELLVCRCSKVVPNLPRVDLCADCRLAMMQCKLLSTRDAAARKRQLIEKARYSIASTASTASSSLSSPAVSTNVQLQTRRGSLRLDGQTPDDTDTEVLSLRMLIPIREDRPASIYRKGKKEQGNVLTKMLTKHENRRRLLASDLIPATYD